MLGFSSSDPFRRFEEDRRYRYSTRNTIHPLDPRFHPEPGENIKAKTNERPTMSINEMETARRTAGSRVGQPDGRAGRKEARNGARKGVCGRDA